MNESFTDPVCGMTIDKSQVAVTLEYGGKTYYFCSPGCKVAFEREPERYAESESKPESSEGSAPGSSSP